MRICFSLPHVFYPGASPVDNAYVLRTMLDCLITLNREFLKFHKVPTLYKSGVRYGRTTLWECIPALYQRGYGDCKSLTAALIAEYRNRGIECEPVFRWKKSTRNPGFTDYHILVQTATGFEDPSKVLGMGRDENARPNPG